MNVHHILSSTLIPTSKQYLEYNLTYEHTEPKIFIGQHAVFHGTVYKAS
jgi:hypothetical protein